MMIRSAKTLAVIAALAVLSAIPASAQSSDDDKKQFDGSGAAGSTDSAGLAKIMDEMTALSRIDVSKSAPFSDKAIDIALWTQAAKSAALYPELKVCEAADWSKAGIIPPGRDESGKPATGWNGWGTTSLVLLTKTSAYYYHQDCDICAAVTKCDLADGRLSDAATAHSVDCGDMKQYRSEPGVVYDACAVAPR